MADPRTIVSDGSVLRRLPTALDSRQRLVLDGIRLSAEMVGVAYDRLARAAHLKTQTMGAEDDDGPTHADLFIDAWSIIDSVHRLRSLMRSPILSPAADASAVEDVDEDPPTVEITLGGPLRGPSVVTELRDAIQHLDGRIAHIDKARQPVYGTLFWAVPTSDTETTVVIATPGSAVRWKTPPAVIATLAGTAQPPIDHIHLVGQQTSSRGRAAPASAELVTGSHPGTITVSLTELVLQTAAAVTATEDMLRPQFEGLESAGSDLTMALVMDFSGESDAPGGNPMESEG